MKQESTPNEKFKASEDRINSSLSHLQALTDTFCLSAEADIQKMITGIQKMRNTIDEIKKL
jgi:hypothetical protein